MAAYLSKEELHELREFLPSELEGFEAPDHYDTNGFICPVCSSGTQRGYHSTGGVSYFRSRADGTYLWKCKSCGAFGDIFEFVELSQRISKAEAVRYVRDKYLPELGETVTEDQQQKIESSMQVKPKQPASSEAMPKQKNDLEQQPRTKDYSQFIDKHRVVPCSRADAYFQVVRGFTKDTIRKFRLAYVSEESSVLIPFIDEANGTVPYYIARFMDKNANPRYKNLSGAEAGGTPLYHPSSLYENKPCFIVEGAFDAISVLQAGGEAVALNGSNNGGKLIKALRVRPTASTLVISFDNDKNEFTAKSARELTERLQSMGFRAVCDNSICGDYKDPNEHLVADPAGFKTAVQAKIEELSQQSQP